MSQTEERLKELGLTLVRRSKLPAKTCQCKRHGNLLFVGGVYVNGEPNYDSGAELGKRFLAIILAASDGMDDIEAVLSLTVAIRGKSLSSELESIADGVSSVLTDSLGARGLHTRTVLGTNALEKQAGMLCSGIILLRSDRVV